MKKFPQSILDEYDQTTELHTAFMNRCEALVKELLQVGNIPVHETNARLKDRNSLLGKLERSDSQSKYSALTDIKDVIGLRVITYFNDEVDKVAAIIQREFNIDDENSTDKRALLEPDRFGYLSLHFIASLSPSRLALAEYQRFENCVFEIQIRSILQHTWAEIQHDLGYKSKIGVPEQFQRQFAILAGILENADVQFAQIRDGLATYQHKVQQEIDSAPQLVQVNQISLAEFVKNAPIIKQINDAIVTQTGAEVIGLPRPSPALSATLDMFGIQSIAQLQEVLSENERLIPLFIKDFASSQDTRSGMAFAEDVSIFYLFYVLAMKATNGVNLDRYIATKKSDIKFVNVLKSRVQRAYKYAIENAELG